MPDDTLYRDITRQIAGFVATELGDGWTCDTDELYASYPGVYIDGPDSLRLYLRLAQRDQDKVEVSGTYPNTAANAHPRVERVEIKVGRFRGPDVIASEIKRRLLPKYQAELARVHVKASKDDIAQAERDALAAKLSTLLPGASIDSPRGRPAGERDTETKMRFSTADGYGDLRINYRAESVSMELHGITAKQAVAIARILKGDR